jgi:hypothetical protein
MKNQMIMATDAERTFAKLQHPFVIKALNESRIGRSHLNLIKVVQDKPIAKLY